MKRSWIGWAEYLDSFGLFMPMLASSSPLLDAEDSEVAARAAALVNPASGLANDYLNVFNEIVMLIDLLPAMPALADDIAAWSPVAYRDYFARSTLAGRQGALRAYDHLDPLFRASFDRDVASLGRLARRACTSVLATASRDSELLVGRCFAEAQVLREKLERVTQTVNHGCAQPGENLQARVTDIFDAA